jgi:hypothetical protein
MARLKGKSIIFEIDGAEFQGAVKNVVITNEVDELGFGAYADSLQFTLQVEGYQDYASTSLWSELYDNPGATMNITYAPHGNSVATASTPHFTMTGYAETLPALGGAAGEYFVFDLNIILDAKPAKVTTGTI